MGARADGKGVWISMKAIGSENIWFEFAGHKNTEYGVMMLSMPTRPHPARRGELKSVPGRNGKLFLDQNAYDQIVVSVRAVAVNGNMDAVNGWLSGSGDLRFGDDPNRVYKATVTKEFSTTNRSNRLVGREFTVSFDCYPFRYVSPALSAQSFSSSPATINNPGTVFSQPEIRIACTGAFTLVVNGYQIDGKAGASGGVIVDCELNECFNLNKTELRNTVITLDEFPRLDPGVNAITWTGAITSVEITPRWRYL